MGKKYFTVLAERGLLSVAGADARHFLQGLVSNDVEKVSPERAVHAALLTAQGKYLHDFFIAEFDGAFLLDAEAVRLADLKRRLSLYKLRAAVSIEEAGFKVAAAFGEGALAALELPTEPGSARKFGEGLAFTDPRLVALGARLLLPDPASLAALGFEEADPAAYDLLRLELGVPDGSRDLDIDKTHLLEAGFDELNGVDWKKGCYVGQELTARTKYRGLVKKRLIPVRLTGPLPASGAPVMLGSREAGEIRSGRDGLALAILRLDAIEEAASSGEPLLAGETRVQPVKPDWARF